MLHLKSFTIFESKSNITFNKQPKKKGAKTDVYNVAKSGTIIGQIKWSSRMRGYAFLPTQDCDLEIKNFVKDLMSKRRAEKKKNKVNENHSDRDGLEDYYEYTNFYSLIGDERGEIAPLSIIKKITNKYSNLDYSIHFIDKKQNKFESSYGYKQGIKTTIFNDCKDYDCIEFTISEVSDDYYLIRIFYLKQNSYGGHSTDEVCYKCDQLDGLYKCIEDKILNS